MYEVKRKVSDTAVRFRPAPPKGYYVMKYKMVVDSGFSVYVKDRSKSKDHLIKKAEALSKKHPRWKVYVVSENVKI